MSKSWISEAWLVTLVTAAVGLEVEAVPNPSARVPET